MKKLNITKEAFEKSKYFKNKYGNLEYVSESGKVFKTNKGRILMFKESTKKFAKEAYARGVSKRSLKELKSALETIEVILSDNDQELTTVLPQEFERMLRVAEMKVQRALDMQSKMKGSELD